MAEQKRVLKIVQEAHVWGRFCGEPGVHGNVWRAYCPQLRYVDGAWSGRCHVYGALAVEPAYGPEARYVRAPGCLALDGDGAGGGSDA